MGCSGAGPCGLRGEASAPVEDEAVQLPMRNRAACHCHFCWWTPSSSRWRETWGWKAIKRLWGNAGYYMEAEVGYRRVQNRNPSLNTPSGGVLGGVGLGIRF